FPTGFIGIGESGNIIKSVIIVGATNGTPPKFIIDDFVYESLNPPPPPPPSNPVPEPTTMLLLSGGLLGLAALRRKSA
ncbi:MAG: PEP-CTERM sorting domain-containing protein, partial [Planctomycetes bacterium]|nr:PEP-CTERM sorting domain-containing protein [Planctomycetota bacterium]